MPGTDSLLENLCLKMTAAILSKMDLDRGLIEGASITERFLADLRGAFLDEAAYQQALAAGNPLLYRVSTISAPQGEGQLHYALGWLEPGKVGREYYLTKGHYHAWREAAEVYIGLRGRGCILLEAEASGESRLLPLGAGLVVYVPGHTAHRTINTGTEPLLYLGVYPAAAGHDYEPITRRNFRKVVVEEQGRPVLLYRNAL